MIVWMLIGALLFAWGTGTSHYTKWDENKQVVSGEIVMEDGAYDPEFDVYVESPVLYRQVEMYRYYVTSYRDQQSNEKKWDWTSGWTDNPNAETPSGKENPPWPEGLYNETFYGDVKFIESGFYLSGEVLDHFVDSYVFLDTKYDMLSVGNLDAEAGAARGLHLEDDDCYTNVEGKPEIGDIRITYWAIDPALLEKEYTVAGLVKNGVIGVHEDGYVEDTIYDRVIPAETIKKDRDNFNTIFSIVTRILGAVMFLVPLFLIVSKSASKKKTKKNGRTQK